MAEIDTSSSGGKKGKKRGKKLSTRVDLTPMVDLGFLLITFFMFTTTMSKPKTMELLMPLEDSTLEDKDKNKIKDYTALTLLLSKKNRVYYYRGIGNDPLNAPKVNLTYFKSKDGVRDAIIALRKDVEIFKQEHAGEAGVEPDDEATVLIKPDTTSTYDDMINALDEMQINGIETYAMVDISNVERGFIKATEEAAGE